MELCTSVFNLSLFTDVIGNLRFKKFLKMGNYISNITAVFN